MTVAYSDYALQYGARPLWRAQIVMNSGSGTRTVNLSDVTHTTVDASTVAHWFGGILEWAEIYGIRSELSRPSLSQSDVSMTIHTRRQLGQDNDHTFCDLMNAYQIIGATVTIWQSFGEYDLVDITSTNIQSTRFSGVVFDCIDITSDTITLRARNENDTLLIANKVVGIAAEPNARAIDRATDIPMIVGLATCDTNNWKYRISGTYNATINGHTDFNRMAGYTFGAYKAPMSDVEAPTLYVNSIVCDGSTPPFNSWFPHAGCLIQGEEEYPIWLTDTVYSGLTPSTGKLALAVTPSTLSLDCRRSYTPPRDPEKIRLTQSAVSTFSTDFSGNGWTNPYDAFDVTNLDTYAEHQTTSPTYHTYPVLGAWQSLFMNPLPPGTVAAGGGSDITNAAASTYLWALIYVEKTAGSTYSTCRVRAIYEDNAANNRSTYVDVSQNAYHFVKIDLYVAGTAPWTSLVGGLFHSGTPGSTHFIGLGFEEPGAPAGDTYKVRLYGWGVSVHFTDWPLFQDRYDGNTAPIDKAKFFVNVHGGNYTTDTNNWTDFLKDLISMGGAGPIAATDVNTAASFGGTAQCQTDLDNWNDTILGTSTSTTFQVLVRELASSTLADILANVMAETFTKIWRSTYTGKWNVRAIIPSPTSDGKILNASDIIEQSLSASYDDIGNTYNAIYIDFNYDSAIGTYQDSVFIDGTAYGSRDYAGAASSAYEALADTSQDIYGRRVLRKQFKYIQDALTAWNVCTRMFKVLSVQRITMSFLSTFWAADLEPASVFTTDDSLDDIMRFPGFVSAGSESEPSWDTRKWWVVQVTERPYGPFTVEAINVD